jgi:hypothetical protein
MMFGPKSKTYKWVTALIGRSPVPGEKLEVIGLPCQLILIVDEDSGYNKVESVLPVGSAKPAEAAPARPSIPADDPDLPDFPLEEPPANLDELVPR